MLPSEGIEFSTKIPVPGKEYLLLYKLLAREPLDTPKTIKIIVIAFGFLTD